MKPSKEVRPTAVLVAVQLSGHSDAEVQSSLDELARLADTLGFDVTSRVTQKRESLVPGTAIGEGKLKEIAAAAPKTLIFDFDLSPRQINNLQEATKADVLDRSGVIVEIFHRHAKTKEARLQVEIARLRYLSPRLRVAGTSDRQGGGIGAKGIGETAHEMDRRRIRDRISELQKELESIHSGQAHRREARANQPRVALVGYTNAGKSSLMRALTDSSVLVADKLFATLDTTVRAMQPETHPRVLVSDTVGFIKKLPHDLVASFRSTLDEAHEASLLLYVVDSSDPTFRSQLEVTRTVLKEIGAASIPSLLLLNKVDRLDRAQVALLQREFPDAVLLSALDAKDADSLKGRLRAFFEKGMEEAEILIPYTKNDVAGEIRRAATVVKESFQEDGVLVRIRSSSDVIARFKKKLAA